MKYPTPLTKQVLANVMSTTVFRRLVAWGVRLLIPRHRVGIGVVILDDGGRVLLLNHVYHPATPWGLPGGWLHKNESPGAGAKREMREETGLSLDIGPVVYTSHEEEPSHIGIAMLGRVKPGNMRLSGEILDARWFDPHSLPDPLLPFVMRAIEAGIVQWRRWNKMEKLFDE